MKKDDRLADPLDWTLEADDAQPEVPGSQAVQVPAARTAAANDDDSTELSPELQQAEELRRIALSPAIQALWKAVLPHVGALPSRPDEFPGMFKVEPVPGKAEATVYIDVPDRPYERGVASRLDRVLALKVSLDHDYRRLGSHHYCVDCEVPETETRH